jgi:hypothetical protein
MSYVTYLQSRNNGMLHHFPDQQLKPSVAFEKLFDLELCWGAAVEAIDSTSVSVRTSVFGCTDFATVTGPEKDMEPIVQLAHHYQTVNSILNTPTDKEVGTIVKRSGGRPFLITTVTGGSRSMAALGAVVAQVLELEEDQVPSDIFTKAFMAMTHKDRLAAACMLVDGEDPQEVTQLIFKE